MSSTKCSYSPNYFSIEDILATQQTVPCKFEVTVPRLGSLDPSADNPDLQASTKLELPYWLARPLHGKRIVSVEQPKFYKKDYRHILQADATIVDLHKWGPYFYEFGSYLTRLNFPDKAQMAKALLETLRARLRRIMDVAQHSVHQDPTPLVTILDELERGLFHVGQAALQEQLLWLRRESSRITAAALVTSHRKRKFAEIEEGGTTNV